MITAIGQDGAGELYVVDAGLGPSQGELFQLVPEPAGASLALAAAAALAGLAGRARSHRSTRVE